VASDLGGVLVRRLEGVGEPAVAGRVAGVSAMTALLDLLRFCFEFLWWLVGRVGGEGS
jgi:hypothetical protein